MSRSNGNSHHAKVQSRLVNAIPIFIAFSLSYSGRGLRERFQYVEDDKKNLTVEPKAVSLETFAYCFQKHFK
jgi:hypothetical protein